MKIALYLRGAESGISAQRIQLVDHCNRRGWEVAGEWVDVGPGRSGLNALLMECSASGIDAVAVTALDRLGLSVARALRMMQRLDAMGVGVVATAQGFDTRELRCVFTVMQAFAELEGRFSRERIGEGHAMARAAGVVLGTPNPGLVPVAEREAVIAAWAVERPGGLRGLGRLLGGVSRTTAHKLYRRYLAAGGVEAGSAPAGAQNSGARVSAA